MAPKKGKGKKDVVEEKPKDALSEVDKTFYELQIADINRKLVRLKSSNEELETKNDDLIADYKKLDEDRADVITYLKKTLQVKSDETSELQERVKGLEERRGIETKEFQTKTAELQKDFNVMREQLTSEVKLLTGKLNSLEEFRALRDQLLTKFENQEKEYEEQDLNYKKILYETEKKFIIGKDKLKKDMEAKLLKLAQDFQDATEIGIAASTHRVVRENIAINNELKDILLNQKKLAHQNSNLKQKERASRLALQLAEGQRDKAMEKSIIQVRLIERLTHEHGLMKDKIATIKKQEFDFESQKMKIEALTEEVAILSTNVKALNESLETSLAEKSELKIEAQDARDVAERLREVVQDAGMAVRAAVKLSEVGMGPRDESEARAARQDLLQRLLDVLSVPPPGRMSSASSVPSTVAAYRRGDLGFVPKEQKEVKVPIPENSSKTETEDEPDIIHELTPASSLGMTPSLQTIYSKKIIPRVTSVISAVAFASGDSSESSREGSSLSKEVSELLSNPDVAVVSSKTKTDLIDSEIIEELESREEDDVSQKPKELNDDE